LGISPTTNTKHKRCDAYLWIKIPGESDGKCNGGPKAGMFWGEQAEELVTNKI
jgi:endoglucanase